MSKYRTAMGKTIDMAALVSKNEKTRAVSNASVNSRGDTIDSNGNVIVSANKKVTGNYKKTLSNKPVKEQLLQDSNVYDGAATSSLNSEELTEEEKLLNFDDEDDMAVEKIKAADTQTQTKGNKKK